MPLVASTTSLHLYYKFRLHHPFGQYVDRMQLNEIYSHNDLLSFCYSQAVCDPKFPPYVPILKDDVASWYPKNLVPLLKDISLLSTSFLIYTGSISPLSCLSTFKHSTVKSLPFISIHLPFLIFIFKFPSLFLSPT